MLIRVVKGNEAFSDQQSHWNSFGLKMFFAPTVRRHGATNPNYVCRLGVPKVMNDSLYKHRMSLYRLLREAVISIQRTRTLTAAE